MSPVTASAEQTHGVFISYRREDAAFPAGWLYQQLTAPWAQPVVAFDLDDSVGQDARRAYDVDVG
jgi:hypothetical protein